MMEKILDPSATRLLPKALRLVGVAMDVCWLVSRSTMAAVCVVEACVSTAKKITLPLELGKSKQLEEWMPLLSVNGKVHCLVVKLYFWTILVLD